MTNDGQGRFSVDAKELILCSDERFACETYIFEPTRQEEPLGHLFVVGEIENRGGVGRELLELTVAAIQKEYYRDPKRSASSSFELALHQANLILNDSVERGVKDWMGYFNVAVGVVVNTTLHISVAGQATFSLVRKATLTEVSEGLATYPVTDPLRTFSQVASGSVSARDVLYLGTANFRSLFRGEDLKRFAIDHSAHTIATRLAQLYGDYGLRHPLAVLVVSLLPQYVVQPSLRGGYGGQAAPEDQIFAGRRRGEAIHQASLTPRQPIILQYSWLKTMSLVVGRVAAYGWNHFRQSIWPAIRRSSSELGGQARKSSVALLGAGKRTVQELASKRGALPQPRFSWLGVRTWISSLPRSSKVFAVLAVLFAVALVISLVLLRAKRAEDTRIQAVSEQLHAARVAKDAAAAALIYDNRDQAQQLLGEATSLADQVKTSGLYQDEVAALASEIAAERDRLQKIVRASAESASVVGSWSELVTSPDNMELFLIGDALFTYHPETNAILKLGADGKAERVTQTTEGIGFFVAGVVQDADKTIVLATDAPGVALFDGNDNSLLRQEVALPNEQSRIGSVATFGSRFYIHDQTSGQLHVYNKTLRGYSGGEAWITDESFPKDSIRAIAIDGNVFTLHGDGTIRRLFKGAAAEFTLAEVTPNLASATRIITSEEHQYLYVVDPSQKRVVVFTKEGELVRQILIPDAAAMQDAAVGPAEDTLYVLDGVTVLKISLAQE